MSSNDNESVTTHHVLFSSSHQQFVFKVGAQETSILLKITFPEANNSPWE